MNAIPVSRRIVVIAALVVALGGCSTVKGWFKGKDADAKKAAEPAELTKFAPTVGISRIWKASAGKGEGRLGLAQGPVVADGRVYAAAVEGGVYAFDLQTGKEIWRYNPEKRQRTSTAVVDEKPASGKESRNEKRVRKAMAKQAKKATKEKLDWRFSGGPGAGDGLVAIGTLDGDVIALDAATGAEKWRAKVPNEVIAPPAIGQGLVLVKANDGGVTAFDAASGERRWFWNHEVPMLTVRGNAPVALAPGVVFSPNDDGTLAALNLGNGAQVWSQTVADPSGRSELDRMADVDGAVQIDGTTLFATSFKNETIAIEGPSGRVLWSHENGGAGGLGLAAAAVLVSDPAGTVWALDKYSGGSLWSQPAMARRSLTAPAVQGDYAVVADYDGYVHWLRLDNGELAARERVGGKAVRARPVVADGILIVQNVEGELTAFRLQ